MAKIDLKRVKEYMDLGCEREEAFDLVRAELEEEVTTTGNSNNDDISDKLKELQNANQTLQKELDTLKATANGAPAGEPLEEPKEVLKKLFS